MQVHGLACPPSGNDIEHFDEDGEMYFSRFDRLESSIRDIGKKVIDSSKLSERLDKKIKGKENWEVETKDFDLNTDGLFSSNRT